MSSSVEVLGEPQIVYCDPASEWCSSCRADRVALAVAVPHRDPQRGQHQVGVLGGRGVPADDPLGEDVDDERDVDEPGPGPAVGEVRDPGGLGAAR